MGQNELESERLKFNAVSPAQAQGILDAVNGKMPEMRSCWYCNGAHEHLPDRDVIFCFACGLYYLRGYPAPAIQQRAKGQQITLENMAEFNQTLSEA
jgi:hypothetical protein